ncbi:hypothetical protein CEXT_741981 [Caerostris extrusa]|uniref:Uncharacterized protein n=1 Tax=Caerostris extrusa TaxID=172846 RepID=A0AAV4X5T9_CAEEX|nr:hypothetical protein CEXT_741981 [Caerostris extrusa]
MFHQNFASRTTTLFRTLFAASAANHRSSVHRRKHTWQCAREMYLDHNNLTDLDSVLHPQMYNLDRLHLSHNLFVRVTENSFNGKVNSTRYILLDHCLIRGSARPDKALVNGRQPDPVPEINVFIELTRLQSLQLQDNRIRHVERNTFRFLRSVLEVLDLSKNEIGPWGAASGSCPCSPRPQSREQQDRAYVDVKHRILDTMPSVNSLLPWGPMTSQLSLLISAFCVLQGFEEGEFRGLNRLNHLNLHGNRITTLGGEVHRLVDLEYLTVSSNRIRTLAAEQIPDGLKYLNLTGGLPSQFSARSSFLST